MRKPPAKPGLVCVGVITGARGVQGAVTLSAFCDSPQELAAFKPLQLEDGTPFTISNFGQNTRTAWAQVAEITDRTQAEKLKGTFIYTPQKNLPKLPKGEFYQFELIGLSILSAKGADLGAVDHVYSNGTHSVLASGKHSVLLLPDFCKVTKKGVELTAAGEELFQVV